MSGTARDPEIVFVAAVAENGVIGRDNAMPWSLKSDMKHFRAQTMGRPVVMGRKTFLSIGKALKGRTTIVVTRRADFRAPGAIVAPSIETALGIARGDAMRRFAAEIAVIGGAEIYAQCMPHAQRLEITEIHARPEGDTMFPPIGAEWREIARERHAADAGDSADFSFVTYRRAA